MTNSRAQFAPTSRRGEVEGQHPLAVDRQQPREPGFQPRGEFRLLSASQRDAAFDLADAYDADIELFVAPRGEPRLDVGLAPPLGQRGENIGVD